MPEEKLCISTKPQKNIIYFCSDLLTSSTTPLLSPCLFLLAKLFVGEKVKNFRIHSKKCRYFWINQSRHLLLVKMTNDKEQRFPSKVKLILVSVNFWGHGLDACIERVCDPLIRPLLLSAHFVLPFSVKKISLTILLLFKHTLKPRYNESQFSEFRNIVNKIQLLYWRFTNHIIFDIVNYSI